MKQERALEEGDGSEKRLLGCFISSLLSWMHDLIN